MTFGSDVRKLRLYKKITLRKFAEMLDLSPTYVSKFERGEFPPPSAEVIAKMAVIFGIDPDVTALKAGKIPVWMKDLLKENPKKAKELFAKMKLDKA